MTSENQSSLPFQIRTEGQCVFVRCLKPISEWQSDDGNKYLAALRDAVHSSVDAATWALVSQQTPSSNPVFQAYVDEVRRQLLEEFGIERSAGDVKVGFYHGDTLVISFPAEDGIEYPYYYRGVQLKPEKGNACAI
jgi:hypothetical protein